MDQIKTQFIVFDSKGATLLRVPDLKGGDDAFSFQGILSVIGSIPKPEKTYIFTLNIRNFRVDVCCYRNRFVLSVIPQHVKTNLANCNSIFVLNASLFLDSFLQRNLSEDSNQQQVFKLFSELLPANPLQTTEQCLQTLLPPNIEYVSLITFGNRVLWSGGAPSESPDKFVFSWIAALGAVDSIEETIRYAKLPNNPNIAVFQLNDSLKIVAYFKGEASSLACVNYLATLEDFTTKLSQCFKKDEPLKPHLPDQPSGRQRAFKRV